MRRRNFLPAIVVAVLACADPGFSMGGGYPPNLPVGDKGITGLGEILNTPHRVHGLWVNWNDWFYFRSNAREFTAYLKTCAQLKQTPHISVIHEGAGMTGGLETKLIVREIEIRNGSWVEPRQAKGD